MDRIGIFGGTYNPPHLGHLNIATKFAREFNLSRVMIIPTYTPPHKISTDLASPEDRLNMCKLTFESEIFEVSDLEIRRKGKSYTCETLKELTENNKNAEFYFLVGDDMLLTFHEWRKPEEILKLCTIVSAVRTNGLSIKELEAYAKNKYEKQYDAGRFKFLKIEPLVLSSTEIRNDLKENKSITGLVSIETEGYINKRGLYHDGTQR